MSVKSEFLLLLEQNKGEVISGEAVASALGCSRAAVNKAAKALRDEGYAIDAGQNRGYCLSKSTNMLSEEGIRAHLEAEDIDLLFYPVTDSTNLRAREALPDHKDRTRIIAAVTRQQTGGRGRRGRSFYSPEGGIYLSIVVRPETDLSSGVLLTIGAAVGVYKAVREVCGIELDIKWVNDLFYEGLKVCGILTEAVTDMESGAIEYAIIGIGTNVYWGDAGTPEELTGIAGALCRTREEYEKVDMNRLAASIIRHVIEEYSVESVPPLYIERNFVPGHDVLIRDMNGGEKAHALSIESDGRLKVIDGKGEIRYLSFGDIKVL